MNYKTMGGFALILVGLILTIVSMATFGWYTYSSNGYTFSAGLTQYQGCDSNSCTTYSWSHYTPDGRRKDAFIDGGKQVIAAGIVALVCGTFGFIAAFLAHKNLSSMWRNLAIIGWVVGGSLTILAVILYSKKTVLLDYAFILYLFSSFAALAGCTIILTGPGVTSTS